MAAWLQDRQGHRAEVGHAVLGLDQTGRLRPVGGPLGGRAVGWPTAAVPVPADSQRAGGRHGAAGSGPFRHDPGGRSRPKQAPGRDRDSAVNWLTAALLRCSAGALPHDRRFWLRTLSADADEVLAGVAPAGLVGRRGPADTTERLRWAAGLGTRWPSPSRPQAYTRIAAIDSEEDVTAVREEVTTATASRPNLDDMTSLRGIPLSSGRPHGMPARERTASARSWSAQRPSLTPDVMCHEVGKRSTTGQPARYMAMRLAGTPRALQSVRAAFR